MNVLVIAAGVGFLAAAATTVVVVQREAAPMGPPIYGTDYLLAHPQERSAILLQCAVLPRDVPGCKAAVAAESQRGAYEQQAAAERTRRIRELTCAGTLRFPGDGC